MRSFETADSHAYSVQLNYVNLEVGNFRAKTGKTCVKLKLWVYFN